MQRTNYRINSSYHQLMTIGRLTPSMIMPATPGETFSGKYDINFISNPTNGFPLNRVFLDHYTFYVPHRLVWDQFPNFVSQRLTGQIEDSPTPPTNVPLLKNIAAPSNPAPDPAYGEMPRFFIKQALHEDPANPGTFGFNRLPIDAYFLIWNTFFRRTNQEIQDYPAAWQNLFLKSCSYKARDVIQRICEEHKTTDVTIDTSGTDLSVDTIRQAFAQDEYFKVRDFYGDKYADYLRSLGVNTPWAVNDTPELINASTIPLQFVSVNNTSAFAGEQDESLGAKQGYYQGKASLKFRPTFTPEHGTIMGVYLLRIESALTCQSSVAYSQIDVDDFWSPQYDAQNVSDISYALFQRNNATGITNPSVNAENFVNLKSGEILSGAITGDETEQYKDFYYHRGSPGAASDEDLARLRVLSADQQFLPDYFLPQTAFGSAEAGASLLTTQLQKQSPIARMNKPIR